MQRDKAINVFLLFVLSALFFVALFPIYFSYGETYVRIVTLSERLFSLVFVVLWILLCVYSAWKKKLYLVLGGSLYAILAYLPGFVLPLVAADPSDGEDPSLIVSAVRFVFGKIFELVNAPMVGVSILFSEKTSVSLSRWLLPTLVISYILTQAVRHYRNAYLAEQLHLEDTAYYPNPDLAKEIAAVPQADRVPLYRAQTPVATADTPDFAIVAGDDAKVEPIEASDATKRIERLPREPFQVITLEAPQAPGRDADSSGIRREAEDNVVFPSIDKGRDVIPLAGPDPKVAPAEERDPET